MDDRIPVQLKLMPKEADELREAARAAGRSLPAEAKHRLLSFGLTGPAAQPSDAPDPASGIAGLARHIAEEAAFGMEMAEGTVNRARLLAIVRDVLAEELNELGAEPGSKAAEDFKGGPVYSKRFLQAVMAAKEPPATAPAQLQWLRDAARVGRALGFPDRKGATKKEKGE